MHVVLCLFLSLAPFQFLEKGHTVREGEITRGQVGVTIWRKVDAFQIFIIYYLLTKHEWSLEAYVNIM